MLKYKISISGFFVFRVKSKQAYSIYFYPLNHTFESLHICKYSKRYAYRQIEKIITKVDTIIQFLNIGKEVQEFLRKDIHEII